MSVLWAERQRRTNRLITLLSDYIFSQSEEVTPKQLYGLCALTWITIPKIKTNFDIDAPYIKKTKIPALGYVFNEDYSSFSLKEIADDIYSKSKSKDIKGLIKSHTGFSNYYNAFRDEKSSLAWIKGNHTELLNLFEKARNLKTDKDGFYLMSEIEALPKIPRKGGDGPPENLLTLVFFSLDRRLRFPIINSNKKVIKRLTQLGVKNKSLGEKYTKMISLYGKGGINDAADLDQVGDDLLEIIGNAKNSPTKRLLEKKTVEGKDLPLKDDSDIATLQKSLNIISRRQHNKLTNKVRCFLKGYTLYEGTNQDAMYDILVKKYDKKNNPKTTNDLIIEVKSSEKKADIRMAIGQLFDYWFNEKGDVKKHIAILLPMEPPDESIRMLEWVGIGVLWFSGNKIKTNTEWLKCICNE